MNLFTKSLAVGLVLVAGAAFAEATNPAVVAREALMKEIGGSMKVLGDMAKGTTAFDAAAAEAAKATLSAKAAGIAAAFEANEADPETEAKPEIWTNWDDFVAKAGALKAAADAIDASTVEGVQAGLAGAGGACGACHKAYRM